MTTAVTVGIDSGAGVSVWPTELCRDYPLEDSPSKGAQYLPAGKGTSVTDLGQRTLNCRINGKRRKMRMHVCDVRKPLLSVGEMVDAGHDIYFGKQGSYALHRETGERTAIMRRNGVFVVDLEVEAFKPGGSAPPPPPIAGVARPRR